jgi:Ala-tRNA(Pro) deacylase
MSATRQEIERGDVVTVSGRRVGEPSRLGEILEVLGRSEHPRYAVRWEDGHESILYPGDATTIKPRALHPPTTTDLPIAAAPLVEALREAGLECEVLPHRRTKTAAAEAKALGMFPEAVAKTVVGRTEDGVHVRAVVPASSHVSISKLRSVTGAAEIELLTEPELVSAYPQFELGAVPPFGGPAGDTVVVDRELTKRHHITFDGGVHDTALRMRTDDLIAVAEAEIADIAAD